MSARSYETMINPPIEELLDRVDSKFSLVTLAAKRARQISVEHLVVVRRSFFGE